MSPIEWYYAKDDHRMGPASSAELRQLAVSGELGPDDLVWREGMEEWTAARNVGRLFEGILPQTQGAPPKGAGATTPASSIPHNASTPGVPGGTALDPARGRQGRHLFDMLLDAVRAQFTARFIESTTKIFIACGHYGLYAAMAAALIFALMFDVKKDEFNIIPIGIISVLIFAVLQYTAGRFCSALDRLNRTTSGTISSKAFLDCFALVSMASGLAVLIFVTTGAIQLMMHEQIMGGLVGIILGLVVFVLCQYMAFIALNPETMSISVAPEARAGEEAVGVFSFLVKAMLRLVPVGFGAGVIYGTLMLLYSCYLVFDKEAMAPSTPSDSVASFMARMEGSDMPPMRQTPDMKAMEATWSVAYSAALPFLAYLSFLFYYLSIDVIRAILVVPRKLDVLAGAEKKKE